MFDNNGEEVTKYNITNLSGTNIRLQKRKTRSSRRRKVPNQSVEQARLELRNIR
ncbi:predicted protein [Sclerotinia sclerotiorum 1980 UF-70]|uniref:Uncharacterized protein n=2 Tax=Sclerotinia sclerotiorum (strain ATCC 18683 / 1980 / Ss-1) TaxID=665079 RepID=A7EPK0_SCLS1|nr:predicted protein [Sclerotinia sclerotiorum 1980 UF-70]APA10297.1 hypothetical protein sscle_06g050670 [Sclerotinia sclerotiorum 1980 UF-70]EDO04766.1 predicted protein [Sclerotinia sclerotiorum 1980 UF-70]